MCAAMATNRNIIRLDLSYNSIGHKGCVALGAAAGSNNLQELSIAGNSLPGATEVSLVLSGNTQLTKLDLHHCVLGADGVSAIAQVISNSAMPCSLSLSLYLCLSACLSLPVPQGELQALQSHQNLQWLNLRHNCGEDAAAAALGDALVVNNTLRMLDFSSNFVRDSGGKALFAALQANTSVQHVRLKTNLMGDAVQEELVAFVHSRVGEAFLSATASWSIADEIKPEEPWFALDVRGNRFSEEFQKTPHNLVR